MGPLRPGNDAARRRVTAAGREPLKGGEKGAAHLVLRDPVVTKTAFFLFK